ncbi:MAG: hypothetical protein ACE5I8_11180, partial [Thermodesulfobacteriota bacterium]
DSFEGFPEWAKKTLNDHRDDPREYVYSLEDFECGNTHDQFGRETNVYAGIAWCIGGCMTGPGRGALFFWQIRYMSYNGCKSKFHVMAYIKRTDPESGVNHRP